MSQPARPDPLQAAARVTGAARDLATDLTEGFRKSDRAFKLRTAVVGTWVVLALVTFWVACPSTIGPGNSLGAVVQLAPDSIMGTQVLVHNDSDRLWTDVVFILDDAWRHEEKTMRAGDRLVLSTDQFAADGRPAPRDLKPKKLQIECEQGRVTTALVGKRP
jgi:hypothetical protein